MLGRSLAMGLRERFPETSLLFGRPTRHCALHRHGDRLLGGVRLGLRICYNRKEGKATREGILIGQVPALAIA